MRCVVAIAAFCWVVFAASVEHNMVDSESLFLAFVCFVLRTLLLFQFVSEIFASYECSGAVRFWEK